MIRFIPSHILNNVLLHRMCLRRASMAVGYRPFAPFHLTTDSDLSKSPTVLTRREKIRSLRDSISHKQPAVFGTLSIPADQWTICYDKKGNTHRINLSNASEADLQDLSDACQPATFGVNEEDVLDESYRKACQMDVADFTTNFIVEDSGLMDVIRSELLEGHESNSAIKAELYKLNVYGKGGFFKPHQDTPHSGSMFGSLVIVFPTKHEGGALVLRHGGGEWTFDSAKMVQTTVNPSVAYNAFYSDVEHEVTPVTSGYRVTLTYNLSFFTNTAAPVISAPSTAEVAFRTTLSALLSDKTFMEEGGYLGFGLQHEYPLDPKAGLGDLINCLKGSDAIIQRVCSQLSLLTQLRVIYADNKDDKGPSFMMVNDIIDYSECGLIETSIGWQMTVYDGGERVAITGSVADKAAIFIPEVENLDYYTAGESEHNYIVDVDWVTDLTGLTAAKTSYTAYGNAARTHYMYGNVCLLVGVGPPEDRSKKWVDDQ